MKDDVDVVIMQVSTKSDSSHHDHTSTTGEASSADIAEVCVSRGSFRRSIISSVYINLGMVPPPPPCL